MVYFLGAILYHHRTLRVRQSPPYLTIREPKHDEDEVFEGNARYEGYCADLAFAMAQKLRSVYGIPFNYELRLVKDGLYGAKKTDGTWNGMIGELTRKVRRRTGWPQKVST